MSPNNCMASEPEQCSALTACECDLYSAVNDNSVVEF